MLSYPCLDRWHSDVEFDVLNVWGGRVEVGMDVTWEGMEWGEGERVKVCKWQGGG